MAPAIYAPSRLEEPAYVTPATIPTRIAVWMTRAVSLFLRRESKVSLGFCFLLALRNLVAGRMTKRHARGRRMANAKDTNTGRMTVTASKEEAVPRLATTWTMISPTTSSIMAAEVRTTPSRVEPRPLVPSRVNVVPRLVEHSAAPAAKAWTGEASAMDVRTNERPMGARMPVRATAMDKSRFALRAAKDVDNPPVFVH